MRIGVERNVSAHRHGTRGVPALPPGGPRDVTAGGSDAVPRVRRKGNVSASRRKQGVPPCLPGAPEQSGDASLAKPGWENVSACHPA
jgi:hypothetical protein